MRPTPKPDALVAGKPVPTAWVLLQTFPRFAVLAASENKARVVGEMTQLCGLLNEAKIGERRFRIEPTNMLFA